MPERTSTPAPPWMRRLDRIAGHRILGIPLFLGAITFRWVGTPSEEISIN